MMTIKEMYVEVLGSNTYYSDRADDLIFYCSCPKCGGKLQYAGFYEDGRRRTFGVCGPCNIATEVK